MKSSGEVVVAEAESELKPLILALCCDWLSRLSDTDSNLSKLR